MTESQIHGPQARQGMDVTHLQATCYNIIVYKTIYNTSNKYEVWLYRGVPKAGVMRGDKVK